VKPDWPAIIEIAQDASAALSWTSSDPCKFHHLCNSLKRAAKLGYRGSLADWQNFVHRRGYIPSHRRPCLADRDIGKTARVEASLHCLNMYRVPAGLSDGAIVTLEKFDAGYWTVNYHGTRYTLFAQHLQILPASG
jgi:hypothetical protein